MYRRIVAAVLAVALAVLVAPSLAVAGAAAKPAPTSKVNLNTASAEQLATLPGVGPALAGRIVEYRQKSGSFRATKDVMNVKLLGPLAISLSGHEKRIDPERKPLACYMIEAYNSEQT